MPAPDWSDPLAVLEQILGKTPSDAVDKISPLDGDNIEKPDALASEVSFEGRSLQDFMKANEKKPTDTSLQTVEQCE